MSTCDIMCYIAAILFAILIVWFNCNYTVSIDRKVIVERMRNMFTQKNTPVTFTYYSMKNCGFCKRFDASGVWNLLEQTYSNNFVKFVKLSTANEDDMPKITAAGIKSFPSFTVEKNGNVGRYSNNSSNARTFDLMEAWVLTQIRQI